MTAGVILIFYDGSVTEDKQQKVIPYEDWLAYVREKSIRENGTNNKNTGGKHNGR